MKPTSPLILIVQMYLPDGARYVVVGYLGGGIRHVDGPQTVAFHWNGRRHQ